MEDLVKTAQESIYKEIQETGTPPKLQIDLSYEVGIKLAKNLNANVNVVKIGTLLMDLLIGRAIKENRQNEHIQMSLEGANAILKRFNIKENIKENIRHCILEHHGVKKFYSVESEICCNADCYKFLSIRGFLYAVRFMRDMPFEDLVKLLSAKFNEKSNALTLDICKEELKKEQVVISDILNYCNRK
ncbi:MAG: hypothetical protein WAX66_02915 [Patescibacteria group bacterium]